MFERKIIVKKIIGFEDITENEKLVAYQKMNDKHILRLLKSRYTSILVTLGNININTKDKSDLRERLSGQIEVLVDLIDSAENINKTLLNIKEHKNKQDKSRSILSTLKNKLIIKKTNEIIKE